MVHYSKADFSEINLMNTYISSDDVWSDEVFTFDIETSSAFFIKNKWRKFYYTVDTDIYTDCQKYSWCYIWQFSINEKVYFGRTLEEFRDFFVSLSEYMGGQKFIVWVHNLAFEFQFLLNVFVDDIYKVFARKKRRPMKFTLFNSEFRCTYFLSRLSLADIGNKINTKYKKKSGDLRYDILRFWDTPLTLEEMEYCENDCLVLFEYISIKMKEYDHLKKIPLTQTGEVRVKVKEKMGKNRQWLYAMKKLQPTLQEMILFKDAFAGGLARANATWVGIILKWLTSYDITSEYPYALVTGKFPISHFYRYKWNGKLHDENHVSIMKVKFYSIQAITPLVTISSNKCISVENHILDNGRIQTADMVELCITNIDYEIISEGYTWEKMEVEEYWIAKAGYLNDDYRELVLFFFERKNELKDNEELQSLYMAFKQQLNSLYGAMVTNLLLPDVIFEDGEWKEPEEFGEKEILDKMAKLRRGNQYFSYGQGIYVPAYGRRYITKIGFQVPDKFIYTDTDSIKVLGEIDDIINKYNKSVEENIIKSLPPELAKKCFDKHGILGTFAKEVKKGHTFSYDEFVTFGAKKYISKLDGKVTTTISGLGKKAGDNIKRLEDIDVDLSVDKKDWGYVFGYKQSYKNMLTYMDNSNPVNIRGHKMNYKYGIVVNPTTYTLKLKEDYDNYIDSLQDYDYDDIDLRSVIKHGNNR